jgi:hypothetical protein
VEDNTRLEEGSIGVGRSGDECTLRTRVWRSELEETFSYGKGADQASNLLSRAVRLCQSGWVI